MGGEQDAKAQALGSRFDAAIEAHVGWLVRFQNLLQGIDRETIDPELVRDDTACEFGRWLHANPQAFPRAALFDETRDTHRRFHEVAATTAAALRTFSAPAATRAAIDELDGLSDRLIDLLREAGAATVPP